MDESQKNENHHQHHLRRLFLCFLASALFIAFLQFSYRPLSTAGDAASATPSWGGVAWEKRVRASVLPRPLSATQHQKALSVLVTGAAGFLGAHASVALRRRGDGVLGLDRFDSSYDPSLKRARRTLLLRTGIFVVDGDLSDPGLLSKLLDVTPFTHILHLASLPATAPLGHLDPAAFARADADALIAILNAVRTTDSPPAIVWASSASVYGLNPTSNPAAESDPTDRPATLFAAGKKTAEEIAYAYSYIYGLSITTLRLFTVYGPWGRPDMDYFTFTKAILDHNPVIVFSNPDGTPANLLLPLLSSPPLPFSL